MVLATLPRNDRGRSGGRSGGGRAKVGMLTALPGDTAAWCPAATRLRPATLTLRSTQHSGRAQAKTSEKQAPTVAEWRTHGGQGRNGRLTADRCQVPKCPSAQVPLHTSYRTGQKSVGQSMGSRDCPRVRRDGTRFCLRAVPLVPQRWAGFGPSRAGQRDRGGSMGLAGLPACTG
eukprot:365570-Chlamydomonas_euryale.AAC.4